ncbi:hypothetical protein [Clostridium sp.]|jgi:DNA topoisomerase VI subunit A|uniref:hypothetical protein n=1 Tax=Clostridium sp. TaxID=1506 RepID=UPI003EF0278A
MDFIKEDWKLFRSMDTLTQKAGVGQDYIPALVAKELVDNALDVSENVIIDVKSGYLSVWNDGDGIDESKLCELFSINRPLVTSKLLRLPTRGALGNGLRVVVGAVIATGGKLFVSTRGITYEIIAQDDGSSKIKKVSQYDGTGTAIEIKLGDKLISTRWSSIATRFNKGENYKGKTSAYWYNSESFFELCQAAQGTVHELVQQFEGCTGTKAGIIAKEFGRNRLSKELPFYDTESLLEIIKNNSKFVKPNRLGSIVQIEEYNFYDKQESSFKMQTSKGKHEAVIPFTVEVLAKEDCNGTSCIILVNKTPTISEIYVSENRKKSIYLWGEGLRFELKLKLKLRIIVNINTPYMPITSDGKKPDLTYMKDTIEKAIQKAINKHNKDFKKNSYKKDTQKYIIYENLDAAVKKASGDGNYKFSQRQLYYVVRPFIAEHLEVELNYENFNNILTNYETDHGEIEGLYRDSRGSLYTPHSQETIPIGTLSVEAYVRPKLEFNKILYIEKEGFFEILKDYKFSEKFDCALLTSKGYASRAAKDLIDKLGEDGEDEDEEIQVLCVHDCDKAGTMIYQTLQEKTKTRGKRKVKIIDLGLNPEEVKEMNLEVEKVEENNKPSADYLDEDSRKWLQTNRVELNAMTTPQFLEWLVGKLSTYGIGKVIPGEDSILEELKIHINEAAKEKIQEDILKENNYEILVKEYIEKLEPEVNKQAITIRSYIQGELKNEPNQLWKEPLIKRALEIVENSPH